MSPSPRARAWIVGVAGAIGVLGACGSRAPNSPRIQNCYVEVLPNPPGNAYVEVGELSFEAYIAGHAERQYKSPYALVADMRPEICAVGGDTLVTERDAAGVIVRGTVYRKLNMDDAVPPKAPPPKREICEPACHAGFTCDGGTCVPSAGPMFTAPPADDAK